jgi:hypothetical protein
MLSGNLSLVVFAFFVVTAIQGCGGGDTDGADPANSTLLAALPRTGDDNQQGGATAVSSTPLDTTDAPTDAPPLDTTDAPTDAPTETPERSESQTTSKPIAVSETKVYEFTPEDLRNSYYQIFQTGNRNAASFKWFQFIKTRKENPRFSFDFEYVNKFYCPVSGSPTYGNRLAKITLPRVGTGEPQEGSFSYCCTPCFCDLMDFAKVDTVTVAGQPYDAIVIGNPCGNRGVILPNGKLDVSFDDPFRPGASSTLADVAPELMCEGSSSASTLRNATLSDGGYPVIGLLFAAAEGQDMQLEGDCQLRAEQGYSSGMGLIFRKAAEINPIESGYSSSSIR